MGSSRRNRRSSRSPLLWIVLAVFTTCRPPAATFVARIPTGSDTSPSVLELDAQGTALVTASREKNHVTIWAAPFTSSAPAFDRAAMGTLGVVRFASQDIVFAATDNGTVVEWNWKAGSTIFEHKFSGSALAARSGDGRYVAYGGEVLDRKTGRDESTARIAEQSAIQFSANGTRLLSASFHDRTLLVRGLPLLPGGEAQQWQASGDIRRATINARGDRVAAALRGDYIEVWQLPSRATSASWSADDLVMDIAFLSDGEHVVVADQSGIQVHDATTGQRTFRGDIDGKLGAFSVDGDIAAGGSLTGEIVVWDLAHQKVLTRATFSGSRIDEISVRASARRLATADKTGVLTVLAW